MPLVYAQKARRRRPRPRWQDTRPEDVEQRTAYAIAADEAPKFARVIRQAMRDVRAGVDEQAFRAAVRARDIEGVVQAFEWSNPAAPGASPVWESVERRVINAYGRAIERSGQAELRRQGIELREPPPNPVEIVKRFQFETLDNPFSKPWAEANAARLVQQVSDSTQSAIRDVITDAFEENRAPITLRGELSDILLDDTESMLGLTAREAQAVVNRRNQLAFVEGIADEAFVEGSVRQYAEQLLRLRAMRIARTETIDAEAGGLMDSWRVAQEQGLVVQGAHKEWIASSGSGRTCKICLELDGQIVPLDENFQSSFVGDLFRPPSHPHCLPGDARVLASGVSAKSERAYQGDLVVIRTALGNRLTCTPNHPVLTDVGWLPARSIQVGSHVVSAARSDWATPGVVDDEQNVPSVIQKIADFALVERASFARRVPSASQDFHGDGGGSEVAVVRTYRDLSREVLTSFAHQLVELHFDLGAVTSDCLERLGTLAYGGFGHFAAAHGIVSGGGQGLSLFGRHGRMPHVHRRASSPRFDASFQEAAANSLPADAEGFAQRLLADSASVLADKVVSVDVQSFHGPVFNLETNTGAYIAQGIVTHNCRCSMGLVQ